MFSDLQRLHPTLRWCGVGMCLVLHGVLLPVCVGGMQVHTGVRWVGDMLHNCFNMANISKDMAADAVSFMASCVCCPLNGCSSMAQQRGIVI
jgi:hypothetical protein